MQVTAHGTVANLTRLQCCRILVNQEKWVKDYSQALG